jgi:hypothetical protein
LRASLARCSAASTVALNRRSFETEPIRHCCAAALANP